MYKNIKVTYVVIQIELTMMDEYNETTNERTRKRNQNTY